MAISNILSGSMWARSSGQHEVSLTIARPGGSGWAFAEAALVRTSGFGAATVWISEFRYRGSSDQILVAISPNPEGASSARWVQNCLSVTFTLRVVNHYAYSIVKLSPWD